jgi:hypothetical protein
LKITINAAPTGQFMVNKWKKNNILDDIKKAIAELIARELAKSANFANICIKLQPLYSIYFQTFAKGACCYWGQWNFLILQFMISCTLFLGKGQAIQVSN